MKAGTLSHPKTKRLMKLLDKPLYVVAGILECLWQFGSEYAIDGVITKYTADEIADWFGWEGDSEQLISALALSGFLDRDGDCLVIHDWDEHCPDYVRKRLVRRKNKDLEQETADNGGQRRTTADNGGQRRTTADNGCQRLPTTTITTQPNQDQDLGEANPDISPPTAEDAADVLAAVDEPVTEFVFPCVGNGSREWALPVRLLDVFRQSYPAVNVEAEIRKALAWCHANPKERKTANGMSRFLNGWMSRNQNKNRAGPDAKTKQSAAELLKIARERSTA